MKNTTDTRPDTTPKRAPMLYRISSVMDMLEVSNATIYRMIARGELERVRLSLRSSRITSESVARILDRRLKED